MHVIAIALDESMAQSENFAHWQPLHDMPIILWWTPFPTAILEYFKIVCLRKKLFGVQVFRHFKNALPTLALALVEHQIAAMALLGIFGPCISHCSRKRYFLMKVYQNIGQIGKKKFYCLWFTREGMEWNIISGAETL